MCSHSNPPERNMCEQCGARLIPLVAPSPLQEPTDAVQDQGLPFPTPPPDALPTEAPSGRQDDETDQEVPDWLQRMRDTARSDESPGDDWPPEPEPEAPAGEDVDWLSRLESSGTPSLEETEPDQAEAPDWLGRLGPMPAEEEPVTPSASEAEVPDWLARLTPVEEEQITPPAFEAGDEPELPPLPSTEVPDWLAELRASEQEPTTPPTTEVEQEPMAPTSPAEADVPDWLIELTSDEEEPIAVPPSGVEEEPIAAPSAEAEVPDWLAELTSGEQELTPPLPVEIEEEPGVSAPPAEAEVPDWLTELAPAEEQPATPSLAEAEVPDWIAELAPAEQEPDTSPPAETEAPEWLVEPTPAEKELTAPPLAAAELPDWLKELAPADEEPAAPPPARDEVPEWLAEPALAEAEIPDWLVESTPPEPEPTALPAEAALPDWLTDLAPPEEESVAPLPIEAGSAPEESGLAQAEIPVWLQALRPGIAPPPALEEEEEEEVIETSGLLAGISGVIQPASAVTPLPTVPAKPEQVGAEAALARARLWQELIARSAQPVPLELPQPQFRKARDRIERWLVYGLVLVAVLVPILAGINLSDAFGLDEPLTEGADAAFDLIDERVTQDALVLMAFDYDPSFTGELQVLAEALLHQLAQNRGRIVAMSLTPEGASLAQQLLEDVLEDEGYQAGQDYVNLGYLPGEAIGIRSLEFLPGRFQDQGFDGRDLKETFIFENDVEFALSNMSLMVVLTGNANNLRWWVEQITAVETDLEKDLFLVAGVSAAIEPLVRPYYDMSSPQIDGLIVGLKGAVDYERRLNWQDGPAHIRLSGQVIGQIAVLALILIGMLIYGVSRRDDVAG